MQRITMQKFLGSNTEVVSQYLDEFNNYLIIQHVTDKQQQAACLAHLLEAVKQQTTDTIDNLIYKINQSSLAALKELPEKQLVDITIQGMLPETRITVLSKAPEDLTTLKEVLLLSKKISAIPKTTTAGTALDAKTISDIASKAAEQATALALKSAEINMLDKATRPTEYRPTDYRSSDYRPTHYRTRNN
ncbi:hypothetical protein LOTGIDRAFT_174143 [Lottia gigantea]|uniref:Uncharacterized protein n=1 Tax=Lottia gigantea TaxID=225164 RepID=V4A3X4_LOTGI|nr:hypothetical protein LOTGIDRAFT_174143 [Lottia gigantea]ESO98608.1 hypothetical protein LOTGIDRAFT_174143 [Lottia gigantea]